MPGNLTPEQAALLDQMAKNRARHYHGKPEPEPSTKTPQPQPGRKPM